MAENKPDSRPQAQALPQAIKEAWMSVLGVLSSAETEVGKAAHRLLESIGLRPEGEQPLAAELMARMRKNREEFERRVDEGVKSAVALVRAPIDKEIAQLKVRLEQVQSKFDDLQKRGRARKKKGET